MKPSDHDSTSAKRICRQCVGAKYLSEKITRDGTVARCGYCGDEEEKTWSIGGLADIVEKAFEDHYVRTSDQPSAMDQHRLDDREDDYWWAREGDRTVDAIQAATDIPEDAAVDVQEILGDRHYDHDYASMGEETEFGSDAHYERKSPDAASWHWEWLSFERALKTEARYFSRSGATHLAAIFNAIDALETTNGSQLVVEAGPACQLNHLHRARVFQSEDKLSEALCYPDRHLGSPPAALASPGRMNARGISVFYGATDASTAIAEVRPPVGSKVAVARFAITRPLRLLDLTVIEQVQDGGSVFDPTLKGRLERVAFLRTLGKRMSRSVMPDDEAFDYLSTQAIADFLATENTPQLDGIIFRSAQSKEGRNVVLFHRAARTAEIKLPQGAVIEASTHLDTDEGPETYYYVSVQESPDTSPEKDESPQALYRTGSIHPRNGDARNISLCVDSESVEVHHIESVAYDCTRHEVVRHRRQYRDWNF